MVWREVDLRAYAGWRISLQIRAETDGSLNSNLFVDDVGRGQPGAGGGSGYAGGGAICCDIRAQGGGAVPAL